MKDPNQRFGQTDSVQLSDEDGTVEIVEKSVLQLWGVVNQLTRLRRTSRKNYRVSIFGSARIQPGTPAYDGVKKLAAEIAAMGCDILTGGGPGLMQAANEGAKATNPEAVRGSIGINIELPFEQQLNPYVSQSFGHGTFFTRLHHFMAISDAFVVVPGGVGTLLEMSMAWQLLQVKHLYNTPLILVGKMWAELIDWAQRNMLREGSELASAPDMQIPQCANEISDAVAIIRANREAWLKLQGQ